MSRVLAGLLITAVVTAATLRILPWWCGSIIACIVMYILRLAPGRAFVAGLIGVGLAWASLALWADVQNDSILSTRIGALFMGMSPALIVLVTALLGGLSGGLGGITGSMLVHRRLGEKPSSA